MKRIDINYFTSNGTRGYFHKFQQHCHVFKVGAFKLWRTEGGENDSSGRDNQWRNESGLVEGKEERFTGEWMQDRVRKGEIEGRYDQPPRRKEIYEVRE